MTQISSGIEEIKVEKLLIKVEKLLLLLLFKSHFIIVILIL